MSWRCGKTTRCPLKFVVVLKIYLFVLFYFTAESVNCTLFLKNLEKTFLHFDLQKKTLSNTLQIYRNIYRKNISAIIYRLSVSPRTFLKLPIIVNRFSTERFIVPITVYGRGVQPTARGPQSGPPGQSMWPSTMAGQKKFFF